LEPEEQVAEVAIMAAEEDLGMVEQVVPAILALQLLI